MRSPKPQTGKKNKETRKTKLWDRLSSRATWLSRLVEIEAAESGGFKFFGVNGFMGSFLFSLAIWVCNLNWFLFIYLFFYGKIWCILLLVYTSRGNQLLCWLNKIWVTKGDLGLKIWFLRWWERSHFSICCF